MPAKLRDVQRVCHKQYQIQYEPGGKHMKLVKAGHRAFPLPHKDELDNAYVNALCDHFDIPREDFWKHLRGG